MKTSILIAGLMVSLSGTAYADSVKGTVKDVYKNVTTQTPITERVCYDVEVPIYGKSGGGASAGDVLGGMIIGGLLGKGLSGNDNGAAAGAVLGGMVSADKNQGKDKVIGYRQETRCENKVTYQESRERVYQYSTIKFFHNGVPYTLRFQK
jgi:uncharacterized protein YcfJ